MVVVVEPRCRNVRSAAAGLVPGLLVAFTGCSGTLGIRPGRLFGPIIRDGPEGWVRLVIRNGFQGLGKSGCPASRRIFAQAASV